MASGVALGPGAIPRFHVPRKEGSDDDQCPQRKRARARTSELVRAGTTPYLPRWVGLACAPSWARRARARPAPGTWAYRAQDEERRASGHGHGHVYGHGVMRAGTGTGTFTGTGGESALTPWGSGCRRWALILGRKQSACGLKPATPQARSSVVEHYLDTVGVGSSILPAPTKAAVSVLNLRSTGHRPARARGLGPERLPL